MSTVVVILGDALLQQQEVGRRGRARGLRLGLVAIALGILPLPIVVAFFLFGGHARFPAPPQDAGRNAASFHSLTLRMRKFIRSAGPVGFPAESRHPNFEKCQSKLQLSRGKFKVEEIRQKIRLRFIHRSSNG